MNANLKMKFCIAAVGLIGLGSCAPSPAAEPPRKFNFGSGPVAYDYTTSL